VTFAPRDDESLDGNADVTATFPDAAMRSIWGDPDQVTERRLDIIGFDSKPSGTRWQFVLNCDTMEWEWESDWPTLSRAHPAE
jgi:hypothetical protein